MFVKTTEMITITTHMKIVPLPANTGLSIARIDCATPVSDVIIIVEIANNAPDKIIVSHTTPCFPALGISIITSPSTFVIAISAKINTIGNVIPKLAKYCPAVLCAGVKPIPQYTTNTRTIYIRITFCFLLNFK